MPLSPAERLDIQRELAALADGDRRAFEPLFARLWPLVRGFVARRLPPGEAEDVAQQALVNLFARAAEFDPRRDALAWALGIAAWEVRTQRRRRDRRREQALDEPRLALRPDAAPTPEQQLFARELEEALHEALGSVSAADGAALRAFAEDCRPPEAGFRKRLQRALARLRLAWRTSRVE